MGADSSDFRVAADSVFGTLLTITTILSGTYTAITFNWFSGYMVSPKDERLLGLAAAGNLLGLMFVLPLVFVVVAWALSRMSGSFTWRIVAWTGLIYCLTQDFIGIFAVFTASLIMSGVLHHTVTAVALPFVILTPPLVASVLGYRISSGYSRSLMAPPGRKRRGLAVFVGFGLILGVQVLLGLLLLYLAEIMPA